MTPTFGHMLLALVILLALNAALALVLTVPGRRSREEERVMAEWRALRPRGEGR